MGSESCALSSSTSPESFGKLTRSVCAVSICFQKRSHLPSTQLCKARPQKATSLLVQPWLGLTPSQSIFQLLVAKLGYSLSMLLDGRRDYCEIEHGSDRFWQQTA